MKQITCVLASIALGSVMAINVAQASIIQSMTIEEIGVASGGMSNSTENTGGGGFRFDNPGFSTSNDSFLSAGSGDGAIVMGTMQGDLAFTSGFIFLGSFLVTPNTLQGVPNGTIDMNNLILDISGWGANVAGLGYFPMAPDPGSLLTTVAMIDSAHFFYTAEWSHVITQDENAPFAGLRGIWHLEGIATVPEPGTAWLIGAAFVGLLAARRRKSI